jgi:hypothetical protein
MLERKDEPDATDSDRVRLDGECSEPIVGRCSGHWNAGKSVTLPKRWLAFAGLHKDDIIMSSIA